MKKKIIVLLLGVIPFLTGFTYPDTNLSVIVGNVDVPVYNVEVMWGSMEFVFNEIINYEWNHALFTYDVAIPTYMWVSNSNDIRLENKSMFLVEFDLKYNSINSTINGEFDFSNFTLGNGESKIAKLSLDGKLSSNNTNYVKVGTIDLNIS